MAATYSVLRPGAQFKIVFPYFTNTVNFANLFHNNNICFNEHTFRFFSSDLECVALPKNEYQTPSCPQWGLRYSANSELAIEFKTLSIDKFYLPEYEKQTPSEKIIACSSKLNVVEQISYSLEFIKLCPVRPETGPVASPEETFQFFGRRLSFLKEQLDYLDSKGINRLPEIQRSRLLSRSLSIGEGIYSAEQIIKPVEFLIHELDYTIQDLRRVIDKNR